MCASRAAAWTIRARCFELLVGFYAFGSHGATSWLVADVYCEASSHLRTERHTNWTYSVQFTIRCYKCYQLWHDTSFCETRVRASEIPTLHKKGNRGVVGAASRQKFPDSKSSNKRARVSFYDGLDISVRVIKNLNTKPEAQLNYSSFIS